MRREFLINILFLVSINLLVKPFFIFGIDRTVQNTVGTDTYGMYFTLLNLTYLLQIFNDFGIHSFNNRNIARHGQLLEKYFPNVLVLKCFLGLFFIGLTFLIAWINGYREWFHLLFFIAINQLLISLIMYLRSNVSGLAMYRTDSILSAMDKLLMVLFCGILLWVPPFADQFTIEYFAYGQTLALIITALVAFAIVYRRISKLRFRFNPAFLKLILRESYPYALVVFLMMIYTRIDAVMIERLLPNGAFQAGVYASAFRLLDAGNMVGFLFAGLLLPMFARMIKAGETIKQLLRFSLLFIWGGAITIALATIIYSVPIMELLYIEATPYWGLILQYLMLSFIAISGIHIFGTLMTAEGALMKLNLIFFIGVIINIILNFILIPTLKAEGAALATVVTQTFVLLAEIRLVLRTFELKIDYRSIAQLTAFVFSLAILSILIHQYSSLVWAYNYLGTIALGLTLAVVFRLIDLSGIRHLNWNKE
jgi:O-antigen/teichoic acid export membrane protein